MTLTNVSWDNTFSLVCRDSASGQFAVAVSTARLAVGARVPFIRAGVGAVASQAQTNPLLGYAALEFLAQGADAEEALRQALAADSGRESRQLSVMDASGKSAVFTGREVARHCDKAASARGKECCAAGNLLVSGEVIPEMVRAFEESRGFLGERALRALEAGQRAGGDKRGKISAALLVSGKGPHPLLDLRVDKSADPVRDLRVLFDAYTAAFSMDEEGSRAAPDKGGSPRPA